MTAIYETTNKPKVNNHFLFPNLKLEPTRSPIDHSGLKAKMMVKNDMGMITYIKGR